MDHADGKPLHAQLDVMVAAAHRCHQASSDLSERIGQLDRRLSELLGVSWTGDAGTSFEKSFDEWHDGARKVEAGLDALSGLVAEAAREYEGTDDTNSTRLTLAPCDSTELRL